MEQLHCPSCKFEVFENSYFCPNCGKKLKEPPLSTSIGKQIGIYLISIFLPPFGLYPGIKYLLQKDQKRKLIGSIAVVLTVISTVATVWLSVAIFNQFNSTFTNQIMQYQHIGY